MYLKVYFDVDSQSNAEIISRLTTTLGKSKETLAEEAEKEAERTTLPTLDLILGILQHIDCFKHIPHHLHSQV